MNNTRDTKKEMFAVQAIFSTIESWELRKLLKCNLPAECPVVSLSHTYPATLREMTRNYIKKSKEEAVVY